MNKNEKKMLREQLSKNACNKNIKHEGIITNSLLVHNGVKIKNIYIL